MSTAPQPATPAPPSPARFTQAQVMAACRQYGPLLKMPVGLEAWLVMAAIASNESSMGFDCGPRHEPSYDVGGAVYRHSAQQQALVARYPAPAPGGQSPAAMSYGPWQCMLINCMGYAPADLLVDIEGCADAFVEQFNSYVIGERKASTLEEIGEVWNAGHITPDPAYTNKLAAAYQQLAGGN